MESISEAPGVVVADERGVAAQQAIVRQLIRASVPLGLTLVLTCIRIALGTYGLRGTYILLFGSLVAWGAMFLYILPTVLMAYGHERPWWTGPASILGFLPLVYGLYLTAIGGALGAFRAQTIYEAIMGVLFLIAGFLYLRDYSQLTMLGRRIEASVGGAPPVEAID